VQVSHVVCRKPQARDTSEELDLALNREAVIEDFEIIGKGLVKQIVTRASEATGCA